MGPTKTDKARAELQPGQRNLGQRERALLLLADGRKTALEMAAYLGHEGEALVLRLLRDGYLAQPVVAVQPVAADPFDGKRSLATTRMFLFDMCERMFARRAPGRAEAFRESLRQARDRASMLAVGHAMLADIEAAAGPERADSIRERIALLLPGDALAA
nr:hypothetical protein [uncultured Albidiferax sp.]